MSTNATINVVHPVDGSVSSIYLHWGGYPSHAFKILKAHYNTYELTANLCSLGDLSSLDKSAECPIGHSYDNKVDGFSVFYGRDRGEDDVAPKAFNSRDEIDEFHEHNYIFDNGKWSKL